MKSFLSCASLAALTLLNSAAQAGIVQIGSSYTIQGTNAPNNFGPVTLTFDQTTKLIDSGLLNVSEMQVPTIGGGEWDVFSVATASGGPLAGNLSAYWSLGWGFDLSQPSVFDANAFWWSVNGTAVSPISPFGSICCPGTNPVNPALGQAYSNVFTGPPENGFVTYNPTIYVTPYSFVSAGGIDPSTANGFDFAFHFTPASATPEPASAWLLCAGLLGLGACRRKL